MKKEVVVVCSDVVLRTYFFTCLLTLLTFTYFTYVAYLLYYSVTYLLTSCVTSRDPGVWARTPVGYDSNVYLEYLIIIYFTYLVS